MKVVNDEYPITGKTGKTWVKDVDIIYLVHNINTNHWLALEVDLLKRRIKVYDNILSCNKDEVTEACKPFIRMFSALLQAVAPPEKKKEIGVVVFSFYRVKIAPQNIQEGDCGSMKYIE